MRRPLANRHMNKCILSSADNKINTFYAIRYIIASILVQLFHLGVMESHYEVLGVPYDATTSDIKKAYSKAVLIHHPDKESGSSEIFHRIQEAYEILRDTASRQRYDDALRSAGSRSDVPISFEFDLDDLAEASCPAPSFVAPCRCGGTFSVLESDLDDRSDHVIVQCGTCSLFARIHYTVLGVEEAEGGAASDADQGAAGEGAEQQRQTDGGDRGRMG